MVQVRPVKREESVFDLDLGAQILADGRCRFRVWAPGAQKVEVQLVSPLEQNHALEREEKGYWSAVIKNVPPGTRYFFGLDQNLQRPDPASHFQPEGVHQFSEVVDHSRFIWEDSGWEGIALKRMVLYELHVGAFTSRGTFQAVIPRLGQLKELGVNTLSLMPVAQFPGERNWGYDGVFPFAVQNSYGGPPGLKTLVNACHNHGISVVLDVVYNHLGPEGNYLHDYGPYFTDKYQTPWGDAVNLDDAWSDEVRHYFIQNALHWFQNYHADGLRLDAVHAMTDMSAYPFLRQLADRVAEYNQSRDPNVFLMAESDLNDPQIITPPSKNGYGLDAQWCDDFHHSLHALLTGEKNGYYADFGSIGHLAKSLKEGYVLTGDYSVFRKRRHGCSSRHRPASQFVVFSQNHDQVGNRMLGERLSSLVSFEALKLAAGAVILSPYIPMLFMGEEYGEKSPFQYFVSHSDPELAEAVRQGRTKEFPDFIKEKQLPDPQSVKTFKNSCLKWARRYQGDHRILLEFYRTLLNLRKTMPALSCLSKKRLWTQVDKETNILFMQREKDQSRVGVVMNFSPQIKKQKCAFPSGVWSRIWDSSEKKWAGPGSRAPQQVSGDQEMELNPWSFCVYEQGES